MHKAIHLNIFMALNAFIIKFKIFKNLIQKIRGYQEKKRKEKVQGKQGRNNKNKSKIKQLAY